MSSIVDLTAQLFTTIEYQRIQLSAMKFQTCSVVQKQKKFKKMYNPKSTTWQFAEDQSYHMTFIFAKYGTLFWVDFCTLQITDMADLYRIKLTEVLCNYYTLLEVSR